MIWLTEDCHFGHEQVVTKMSRKGFASIEEHDIQLLDNINRLVDRGDTLWILGDFTFAYPRHYKSQIRCKDVRLILGNHDNRNRSKAAFKLVYDVRDIKIKEQRCFLSHYSHAFWPASHYGAFHCYGHNHAQRESTLDYCFPGRRSMDVGVDNIKRLYGEYRPISEDELYERLISEPGHDLVSFYRGIDSE